MKGTLRHDTDGVWCPSLEPMGYRRRGDRDACPVDTRRRWRELGPAWVQPRQPSPAPSVGGSCPWTLGCQRVPEPSRHPSCFHTALSVYRQEQAIWSSRSPMQEAGREPCAWELRHFNLGLQLPHHLSEAFSGFTVIHRGSRHCFL